jgi:hypothetical protein
VKHNSISGSKSRSVNEHMTCGDTEPVILYGQQTEIRIWLNDLDTARVTMNSLDRFLVGCGGRNLPAGNRTVPSNPQSVTLLIQRTRFIIRPV